MNQAEKETMPCMKKCPRSRVWGCGRRRVSRLTSSSLFDSLVEADRVPHDAVMVGSHCANVTGVHSLCHLCLLPAAPCDTSGSLRALSLTRSPAEDTHTDRPTCTLRHGGNIHLGDSIYDLAFCASLVPSWWQQGANTQYNAYILNLNSPWHHVPFSLQLCITVQLECSDFNKRTIQK